jgi:predicted nucleic acid-binding protein
MLQLFLDTNVMIDFLSDRKPFSRHASRLISCGEKNIIQLHVSAISFNNSYYILEKENGHHKTIAELEKLESMVSVIDLTKKILKDAMRSSFSDFEDAIQYFSALTIQNIAAIVTRNETDFKHSSIPVLSPQAAVTLILNS